MSERTHNSVALQQTNVIDNFRLSVIGSTQIVRNEMFLHNKTISQKSNNAVDASNWRNMEYDERFFGLP